MTSEASRVFDTDALISALLIRDSISRTAFNTALDHYQLFVSEATAEEFDEVAGREKFETYLRGGVPGQPYRVPVDRRVEAGSLHGRMEGQETVHMRQVQQTKQEADRPRARRCP